MVAATPDLSDPAKAAAIADYIGRVNGAYTGPSQPGGVGQSTPTPRTSRRPGPATVHQGEAQNQTTIGPTDSKSIAAEQAIANTFLAAGILSKPVTASSFWTTQLDAQISADEATYS